MIGPLLAALAFGAPHLAATRTTTPPTIDGRLDDAAWSSAEATSAFTQKFPNDASLWQTYAQTLRASGQLRQSIDAVKRTNPAACGEKPSARRSATPM